MENNKRIREDSPTRLEMTRHKQLRQKDKVINGDELGDLIAMLDIHQDSAMNCPDDENVSHPANNIEMAARFIPCSEKVSLTSMDKNKTMPLPLSFNTRRSSAQVPTMINILG